MVRQWINTLYEEIMHCSYGNKYPFLHGVYIKPVQGHTLTNNDNETFEDHGAWIPDRVIYYVDLKDREDMRFEYITDEEYLLLEMAYQSYLSKK